MNPVHGPDLGSLASATAFMSAVPITTTTRSTFPDACSAGCASAPAPTSAPSSALAPASAGAADDEAEAAAHCAFLLADSSYQCHCAFRSCMLELVGHFRRCGECSYVAVCSDDGAAPCTVNHWLEHRDECTSMGSSGSRACMR